jgi:hypothetical protein
LLKNLEFVIPNGVREVRYGFPSHVFCAMNLSSLGILIEEGFLASLGVTAKRIFQQALKANGPQPLKKVPPAFYGGLFSPAVIVAYSFRLQRLRACPRVVSCCSW